MRWSENNINCLFLSIQQLSACLVNKNFFLLPKLRRHPVWSSTTSLTELLSCFQIKLWLSFLCQLRLGRTQHRPLRWKALGLSCLQRTLCYMMARRTSLLGQRASPFRASYYLRVANTTVKRIDEFGEKILGGLIVSIDMPICWSVRVSNENPRLFLPQLIFRKCFSFTWSEDYISKVSYLCCNYYFVFVLCNDSIFIMIYCLCEILGCVFCLACLSQQCLLFCLFNENKNSCFCNWFLFKQFFS